MVGPRVVKPLTVMPSALRSKTGFVGTAAVTVTFAGPFSVMRVRALSTSTFSV